MTLEILRTIGLTNGEIKVYSAILDIGISSLNKIQEKTAIERRNIYDILNKLIEKGLVSYTLEKGKRTYQLTDPRRILNYLDEKKNALEASKADIEKELPSIIRNFESTRPMIGAEVYRGKEGIKAVVEDMLNYKENWIIGGNGGLQKYMPFYWIHLNKKRITKKVIWHDLIDEGTLMDEFKSLSKAKEKLAELQYYEYKVLPPELVSPNVIVVYGDKAANILWSDHPFTFVIQNADIADSYKKYFSYIWKTIKS